ncbi:dihydroorotate dehydrogenase (quinone) [Alicyclobacillus cellulosilyticus]|uniref:Dihydroorotate dehydrogenase (quinone) n=1 Tax=Alicyclobacillus cellulosilyticus TaxID=1003997 RepID=A0A917K5B7_9BACL|nr:dihydroorotate dehydrogenase (quinone) [Alicyclobacillus cellulosilyticus]GGI98703.1 dihydroorotate dehydrogenase (quinone) [Alicyclobacillus cellulosilyticus]
MYPLVRSALFRLDPELAHRLVLHALAAVPGAVRLLAPPVSPPASLQQTVFGRRFPHPLGLAAGLDKDGIAVNGLFDCGFSFVEVGTVTPRPQPGNPRPRLFRLLEDQAIINRMGFNNAGVAQVCRNLMRRRRAGVVGVNIGKNKDTPNDQAAQDYLACLEAVFHLADYVAINVSSPNTPGLRDLQDEAVLIPLVRAVIARRDELYEASKSRVMPHRPPVLVKLAPDLDEVSVSSLARQLMAAGVDGFIATNTTVARPPLKSVHRDEPGGLSGRPLKDRSTQVIRWLYAATGGRVPIIGCGGVFTADDAYEKIRAGASLVQVYTSFIYEGPQLVRQLVHGLAQRLAADGLPSLADAVGRDTAKSRTAAPGEGPGGTSARELEKLGPLR